MRRITLRLAILPILAAAGVALLLATPRLSAQAETGLPTALDCTSAATLYCPASSVHEVEDTVGNLPLPALTAPTSPIATPTLNVHKPISRTVTYDVTTNGAVTADFAQFQSQVAETYADARGWSRLGVQFKQVVSGGQFTVVLAEAAKVPTYGYPCDSTYSCTVGRYVIINQDRWLGATDPWNQAGGSLRDYRHMVVNHETGHWLGHGHITCTENSGQAAPVMQQQSINLHGCKFNPWPLDSEIWSTTLGIQ